MGYRGIEIPVFDLTGGQASNRPPTGLELNQALLVQNVHSLPGGGIELRQGDAIFNSTAMSSGDPVQALHYYRKADRSEFLLAIAGSTLYKSDSLDGTMDDITSGLTITSGKDNKWTGFTAGNLGILVGGPVDTFDTPIKFDGTTAAILSASAPSGKTGFFHNNRVFILDDDTIHHSTLTDITDFSGEGSGSAEIDKNDGDKLMAAAPLTTDTVLLFKENSIHQYITTQFPFGRFPLFTKSRDQAPGVGAAGPHCVVVHQGTAYFLTKQARMKATNGSVIIDFPSDMDDVWDTVDKDRLEFAEGFFYQGKDYRYIGWAVSTTGSTTNDLLIFWDLDKKSWWQYQTGYKLNVVSTDSQRKTLYAGHYDGIIYKKDVANRYTDESEDDDPIIGKWRWGWQTNNSFQVPIHPQRINVSVRTETRNNLQIKYGFDFNLEQRTATVSLQGKGATWDVSNWDEANWADFTDLIRNVKPFGRGNAFSLTFDNDISTADLGAIWDVTNWDEDVWGVLGRPFRINGFTITGKQTAQKVFNAQ